MKYDDGVSEILGFILVLTVVLTLGALITAAVLPNVIKEAEITGNEEALCIFSAVQSDWESLCLAEAYGTGKQTTQEIPKNSRISLSYGIPITGSLREAVLTYETENILAENIRLTINKEGLSVKENLLIPSAFRIAVDSAVTPEQQESGERTQIEYTYLKQIQAKDGIWHLFSVRLA